MLYVSKSMLLLESIYGVCLSRFTEFDPTKKTGFLNLLPSRRPTSNMLTIHHVFASKEERKEAKWEENKEARREAGKKSKRSIDWLGCDSRLSLGLSAETSERSLLKGGLLPPPRLLSLASRSDVKVLAHTTQWGRLRRRRWSCIILERDDAGGEEEEYDTC